MASRMMKFKAKRSPLQVAMLAMILALVCCFFFSAVPTQWFASKVHYDQGLGAPLWVGPTYSVYLPTDWIEWGWRLADYPPLKDAVKTMTFLGYGAAGLGMSTALIFLFLLKEKPEGLDELHGSAAWANTEEVDSTGFFPTKDHMVDGAMVGSVMLDKKGEVIHPMHPDFKQRYSKIMEWRRAGIRVCKVQKRNNDGVPQVKMNKKFIKRVEFLRADDPTHILAFAPTRSGKGVGLVLPTLLTWRHSVIVNDIKGENWALSSGFRRAAGQYAIKFEPACQDGSTACWNPLDEIRAYTPNDVQDAQSMMMMVCDPKGEGLEDHWAKTSWEFLSGLALHMRYAGGPNGCIAGMASYLGDPLWQDEKQMYLNMQNYEHDKLGTAGWLDTEGRPTRTHPMIANAAKTMLNKEDKERGSVLSTAKSFLSLYLDPIIAKNTSRSDFLVRDLMNSDKPVSLYFIVQPGDLERMVPLSRLFWAMVIRRNATDMHFAGGTSVQGYKHRLLMLIDELPALKKLSVLQEGLGYIAGYGIKCYLICQDLIQLEDAYGDKQTIVAGCHTRIGYAPNTQETAEKLSSLTGKTTIIEENHSDSRDAWGWKAGNVSISTNKTERALMTPGEFMSLSPEDMVLFVAGRQPIYGRKIKYYEDKTMLGRAKMKAPVKTDVIRLSASETITENRAATVAAASAELTQTQEAMMAKATENRERWLKAFVASAGGESTAAPVAASPNSSPDATGSESAGDASTVRAGAAIAGTEKRRSIYGNQSAEMSEADRAKLRLIVDETRLVEKVAAFAVF